MSEIGYEVSPRVMVLDEPEYTASYHVTDLGDGRIMTFVHLDVFFWHPQVLRDLERKWALFREHVPITLYAMADDERPVWPKFIKRFGFEFLHDVVCTDGKTRRLFVNYGPTKEAQQEQ